MKSTQQLVELGLFSALMVVGIIGAMYIPVLGTAMLLVLPLPVIVLSQKHTFVNALLASGAAMILAGFIIGPVSTLAIALPAFSVGMAAGVTMRKRHPYSIVIAAAGAAGAVAFFVMIALESQIFGITLEGLVDENIRMMIDMQRQVGGMMSGGDPETVSKVIEQMEALGEVMKLLVPAGLIAVSTAYAAINVVISFGILRRLKLSHRKPDPFERFHYPRHLAYAAVAMMLLAYIFSQMGIIQEKLIMANFEVLFALIFSVQGFSLIYGFTKIRIGKGGSIAVIVILIVFQMFPIVSMLGFADALFDLRRLNQPAKRE